MAGWWQWIIDNAAGLQTFAIVGSAVAAFGVIYHNGHVSRRRATLDTIMKTFLDEREHSQYRKFAHLMSRVDAGEVDICTYVSETPENRDERNLVLKQINDYELISLGIRRGLFEEDFYKLWFYTQFTKDYRRVEPLLLAAREQRSNQAIYCEFSALYSKWLRNKHPVKHPGRIKQAWWVITNQHTKLDAARAALRA